jgi:hypothetical protein
MDLNFGEEYLLFGSIEMRLALFRVEVREAHAQRIGLFLYFLDGQVQTADLGYFIAVVSNLIGKQGNLPNGFVVLALLFCDLLLEFENVFFELNSSKLLIF